MIEKVHISRFKSIKELDLDCRRINVFIGEPNTGKSNILEAVGGVFSFTYYGEYGYKARDFFRFEHTSDIFYDQDLGHHLEIACDSTSVRLEFKGGGFRGEYKEASNVFYRLHGDHSNISPSHDMGGETKAPLFKFYRFRTSEKFERRESDFLMPPFGDNLLALLLVNRELLSVVNQPFASQGLKLGLRPHEGKIEVVKQVDPVIVSYPYSISSETLQRVTFYLAAILPNKDSILFFEEPEAHTFPYYTKVMAETIALDQNGNQYFISTHNPYFLLPLLAKAPKDDVAVYIVYYDDHQTKVQALSEEDKAEMLEIDVFSNLERYLTKR